MNVVDQGKAEALPANVDRQPLLQARGVVKNFGAVQALRGVDFEAFSGVVTALLGDNGAGKSTLIKCLAGTYIPDGGQILVDGVPQRFTTPQDATKAGIETIYQ